MKTIQIGTYLSTSAERPMFTFNDAVDGVHCGAADSPEALVASGYRDKMLQRGYIRAEHHVYDAKGDPIRIDSWDLRTGERIPWGCLAEITLRGFGPAAWRPEDPAAYGQPDIVLRLFGPADWRVWRAFSGLSSAAVILPPGGQLPAYVPDPDGRLLLPAEWQEIKQLRLAPQAELPSVWSPDGAGETALWRREPTCCWVARPATPAAERAAIDTAAAAAIGAPND